MYLVQKSKKLDSKYILIKIYANRREGGDKAVNRIDQINQRNSKAIKKNMTIVVMRERIGN